MARDRRLRIIAGAIVTMSLLTSAPHTFAADAVPPVRVGEPPANEATIVRLPDDSHRVYHVLRPAGTELRSIGSTDNGKTWGDDRLEFKLPGVAYYGNQVLIDSDGELQAVFHIQGKGAKGYNGRHYDVWHARTSGGRKTWGEPKRIFEGYVGSMRGFIQLKSGRLVLSVSVAVPELQKKVGDGKPDYGWNDIAVFYSDDNGATWQVAPKRLAILQDNARGKTRYGAVEPHVVQLADGRVWMLIRTKNGFLYESTSPNGVDWSEAKPSKFISSDSPATTARLKDGRLALFVNACQRWDDPMSYAVGGREVLHGAISSDEGKTWQGFREVLYDFAGDGKGDRGTAYPSATETADGMIALVSGQGEGRKSILRVDAKWLSETSASTHCAAGEWPQWTTHEGKGAEIIDHPDKSGAKALSVRKTGAKASAGAAWNFPIGTEGKLVLRIKPRAGFGGAIVSLTDHYSVTGDTLADDNAVYSKRLDEQALAAGQWHDVAIEWKPGGDASVTIDGKPAAPINAKRRPAVGINYLRLRSAAAETDEAGFLVESATATVAPPAAFANVPTPSKRSICIVALGDSITKGTRPARAGTAAVGNDETFLSLLRSDLERSGVNAQVINAGIGSNRTDQGVARLDADVLVHEPHFVTIMYGTNDSCYDEGKTHPRVTVEQFEANLRAIVRRCQAAGATPILMTAPPLTIKWPLATKQPVYLERGVNGPLSTFMDVTRRVAKDTSVPIVDHFAIWSDKPIAKVGAMLPDGCHPNAAGNKAIAAAILPVVLAQLEPAEQARKRLLSGTGVSPTHPCPPSVSETRRYPRTTSRTTMLCVRMQRCVTRRHAVLISPDLFKPEHQPAPVAMGELRHVGSQHAGRVDADDVAAARFVCGERRVHAFNDQHMKLRDVAAAFRGMFADRLPGRCGLAPLADVADASRICRVQ